MSTTGEQRRTANRAVELLLLGVLVGLMLLASHATPEGGGSRALAALGFLLLAGTVVANVLEPLGIPHLTAYLLTGMVAGPHALHLVDHQAVTELSGINALALSLICLTGGAELRAKLLRASARSMAWALLFQAGLVVAVTGGVFLALKPLFPFLRPLPLGPAVGVALVWGVLSLTRSTAATVGVLAQTGARGPFTSFSLGLVVSSDVMVVVLLGVVLTFARPLIDPTEPLSLGALRDVGREVLSSVAVGSTLGLILAAYLRFVGRQLVLLFIALGLVMTQVLDYLRFDWLLIFITAGFVVQNLSAQGDRFLQALKRMGEIVYVIFFAIAGAHLDLPLLGRLWPMALALALTRVGAIWAASRIATRVAGDPPQFRRWSWCPLVSQAGLALGLFARVQGEFPAFGTAFAAMGVATVAVNEMVGPVLFKTALDRTGETARQAEPDEQTEAAATS